VIGARLKSPQFDGHSAETDPLGLRGQPTLEVNFADAVSDFRIPRGAAYTVRESSGTHIAVAYEAQDVEVVERFEMLSGYEGRLEVAVKNRSAQPQQHRLHLVTRVGIEDGNRYDVQRGLCRVGDEFEAEDRSDVDDEPASFKGSIAWSGVDSKYFGTLVVPTEPGSTCQISLSDDQRFVVNDFGSQTIEVKPGE